MWDAGARGEGRAARQLERLRRERFTTLNDVLLDPAKARNLDHVVIGPTGVLFVHAKNWRGRLTVHRGVLWRHWYDGPKTGKQSEPMTREVTKVKGMAARASERLGAPVMPLIYLAGSDSRAFEGVAVVTGVRVVGLDGLVSWLRDSPQVLNEEQVRRHAADLRASVAHHPDRSTWLTTARCVHGVLRAPRGRTPPVSAARHPLLTPLGAGPPRPGARRGG